MLVQNLKEPEVWKTEAFSEEEMELMLELLESHSVAITNDLDQLSHRAKYLDDAEKYILEHALSNDMISKYHDKRLAFAIQVQNNDGSTGHLRCSSQTIGSKSSLNLIKEDSVTELSEEEKTSQAIAQKQKMFPKVPKDLISLDVEKQELMRLSAAYEFLGTEIDYVKDLSVILHVFLVETLTWT